jgi:UDP-glucose 4-epimerase
MFEQTNSLKINYKIGNRRKGDITSAYADTSKIKTKIGWFAKKSINNALKTAWEWQKRISNYEN